MKVEIIKGPHYEQALKQAYVLMNRMITQKLAEFEKESRTDSTTKLSRG